MKRAGKVVTADKETLKKLHASKSDADLRQMEDKLRREAALLKKKLTRRSASNASGASNALNASATHRPLPTSPPPTSSRSPSSVSNTSCASPCASVAEESQSPLLGGVFVAGFPQPSKKRTPAPAPASTTTLPTSTTLPAAEEEEEEEEDMPASTPPSSSASAQPSPVFKRQCAAHGPLRIEPRLLQLHQTGCLDMGRSVDRIVCAKSRPRVCVCMATGIRVFDRHEPSAQLQRAVPWSLAARSLGGGGATHAHDASFLLNDTVVVYACTPDPMTVALDEFSCLRVLNIASGGVDTPLASPDDGSFRQVFATDDGCIVALSASGKLYRWDWSHADSVPYERLQARAELPSQGKVVSMALVSGQPHQLVFVQQLNDDDKACKGSLSHRQELILINIRTSKRLFHLPLHPALYLPMPFHLRSAHIDPIEEVQPQPRQQHQEHHHLYILVETPTVPETPFHLFMIRYTSAAVPVLSRVFSLDTLPSTTAALSPSLDLLALGHAEQGRLQLTRTDCLLTSATTTTVPLVHLDERMPISSIAFHPSLPLLVYATDANCVHFLSL